MRRDAFNGREMSFKTRDKAISTWWLDGDPIQRYYEIIRQLNWPAVQKSPRGR